MHCRPQSKPVSSSSFLDGCSLYRAQGVLIEHLKHGGETAIHQLQGSPERRLASGPGPADCCPFDGTLGGWQDPASCCRSPCPAPRRRNHHRSRESRWCCRQSCLVECCRWDLTCCGVGWTLRARTKVQRVGRWEKYERREKVEGENGGACSPCLPRAGIGLVSPSITPLHCLCSRSTNKASSTKIHPGVTVPQGIGGIGERCRLSSAKSGIIACSTWLADARADLDSRWVVRRERFSRPRGRMRDDREKGGRGWLPSCTSSSQSLAAAQPHLVSVTSPGRPAYNQPWTATFNRVLCSGSERSIRRGWLWVAIGWTGQLGPETPVVCAYIFVETLVPVADPSFSRHGWTRSRYTSDVRQRRAVPRHK